MRHVNESRIERGRSSIRVTHFLGEGKNLRDNTIDTST
jgi:hypothetical protein